MSLRRPPSKQSTSHKEALDELSKQWNQDLHFIRQSVYSQTSYQRLPPEEWSYQALRTAILVNWYSPYSKISKQQLLEHTGSPAFKDFFEAAPNSSVKALDFLVSNDEAGRNLRHRLRFHLIDLACCLYAHNPESLPVIQKMLAMENATATTKRVPMLTDFELCIKNRGKTFESYQIEAERLFKMVNYGFLLEKDYARFDKEVVLEYMKKMPEITIEEKQMKKRAFLNALDKEHPLGNFFARQRGWRATSVTRGTLAKVQIGFQAITKKLVRATAEENGTLSESADRFRSMIDAYNRFDPRRGRAFNNALKTAKAENAEAVIEVAAEYYFEGKAPGFGFGNQRAEAKKLCAKLSAKRPYAKFMCCQIKLAELDESPQSKILKKRGDPSIRYEDYYVAVKSALNAAFEMIVKNDPNAAKAEAFIQACMNNKEEYDELSYYATMMASLTKASSDTKANRMIWINAKEVLSEKKYLKFKNSIDSIMEKLAKPHAVSAPLPPTPKTPVESEAEAERCFDENTPAQRTKAEKICDPLIHERPFAKWLHWQSKIAELEGSKKSKTLRGSPIEYKDYFTAVEYALRASLEVIAKNDPHAARAEAFIVTCMNDKHKYRELSYFAGMMAGLVQAKSNTEARKYWKEAVDHLSEDRCVYYKNEIGHIMADIEIAKTKEKEKAKDLQPEEPKDEKIAEQLGIMPQTSYLPPNAAPTVVSCDINNSYLVLHEVAQKREEEKGSAPWVDIATNSYLLFAPRAEAENGAAVKESEKEEERAEEEQTARSTFTPGLYREVMPVIVDTAAPRAPTNEPKTEQRQVKQIQQSQMLVAG